MRGLVIASVLTALASAVPAAAQDYPTRPITLIVPFPAGGPTDTLARIIGDRMKTSLGQTVIVETVTGAGATIGVARATRAAPDGYTLLIGNWTSQVGGSAIYPVQYDILTDLEPVARLPVSLLMIVGKPTLPAKDAKELITWLRANPGKQSMATVGAGSAAHMCGLNFEQKLAPISNSCPIAVRRPRFRTSWPVRLISSAAMLRMSCRLRATEASGPTPS